MRTGLSVAMVLILSAGLVFGGAVQAQQGGLQCDEVLYALVALAHETYEYHPMVDLSAFDFGVYASVVEGMMSEESPMATEEAMATQEAMATEEADMGGMMMEASCDALRADVLGFVGMQMGMSSGEAAGNMLGENQFGATLSGPEEVPGPGDDDGTGTSTISLDTDTNEVCWEIVAQGIQLPATGAHIHIGQVGESGDVVVPLSPPDASGIATGCTEADAAIVSAIAENPGNYYVNVHTEQFPAGAIRGNLIGR